MAWVASVHRLIGVRPGQTRSVADRPWPSWPVDVALAVAVLAGTLALVAHGGGMGLANPGISNLDALRVAVIAAATVPLVAWRRSPLAVFAVSGAASVLLAALGTVVWPLGPAAALFLLASVRGSAAPWTPRSAGLVAALLVAYLGATVAVIGFAVTDLVHALLLCAAAWFAGDRTRLRREQMAELRLRATLAERETAQERQLAVAEERARIARDLHDSAGHALNVIAVRAGAARLRHDQDPTRSLAALAAIEDIARETVADIDQFIGSLRTDDARPGTVETPAALASLATLVAQREAAGMRVAVTHVGTARPLGGAIDQAAYRILQEALTNAARYGAGTAAVQLAYGEAALRITVTNAVRAGAAAASTHGHGLIGMRERASLLGGDLCTERARDTYRITARLPYIGRRP